MNTNDFIGTVVIFCGLIFGVIAVGAHSPVSMAIALFLTSMGTYFAAIGHVERVIVPKIQKGE